MQILTRAASLPPEPLGLEVKIYEPYYSSSPSRNDDDHPPSHSQTGVMLFHHFVRPRNPWGPSAGHRPKGDLEMQQQRSEKRIEKSCGEYSAENPPLAGLRPNSASRRIVKEIRQRWERRALALGREPKRLRRPQTIFDML